MRGWSSLSKGSDTVIGNEKLLERFFDSSLGRARLQRSARLTAIALQLLKLSDLYYQNTVWVGSQKEQTEMCCKWKNIT